MKLFRNPMAAVAMAALSFASMSALAQAEHHQVQDDSAAYRWQSLNLTSAQKAQIRNIEQQYNTHMSREERQQSRKQWTEQRNSLLKNKNFDDNKARQMIEQEQQKHAQLQLQNLKKEHAICQVLSPKQQEQWLQQRDRRVNKFISPNDK